ncbi:MAG: GNAT family N-acetyltransferase [Pseudomonadota bacterium]
MATLYAQYLAERTSDEILETQEGFATYRFLNDGKTVYIVDIYTVPDVRGRGYAAGLADIIASKAKARGAVEMIGSVMPSAKGSTTSMKVLLAYGMTLQSAAANIVVFKKDL